MLNFLFLFFADARATCLSRGGDLVSIVSMKEKSWLNNRLKTMSGWAYSFWLGLNDRDFPKHFYWSDGSPYKLTAWDAGYPKNTPQSESDYFRYNIIEKFQSSAKVLRDCIAFALLLSVIGLENSRHPLSQSDAKLKPIPT